MKLKKLLLILLTIIIALAIGIAIYIRVFLPAQIAKTILQDNREMKFLSPKLQEDVKKGKEIVNDQIDLIETELNSMNLDINDVLILIDEVDSKDVIRTIKILNSTEIVDVNQVFDLIKEQITVSHLDPEIFRESYLKYTTVKKIKKVLKIIEEHNLFVNISIPTARKTIKQILLEKQDKINEELKEINNRENQ